MSRPLRLEFPGALYHLTSRGDRGEPIFEDDTDRAELLNVVALGLDRFDAECFAFCLMGNHYHFVLQTRRGNLSRLMRHINGVYTPSYKRRHGNGSPNAATTDCELSDRRPQCGRRGRIPAGRLHADGDRRGDGIVGVACQPPVRGARKRR